MVVVVGLTMLDPETATVPTVGAMDTVAAPVVVHANVAVWPAAIAVGDAVKLSMTGGTPSVVAVAIADGSDVFDAASTARTRYRYVVLGVRPLSV